MRRSLLPTIATCLILTLPGMASAAGTTADAVKYRKAVMDGLAAHMNAFMMLSTGRVDHPGHLKANADALAALSEQIKAVFPTGSDQGDTKALPLIWQDRTQFDEIMDKLAQSTAEMRDAVAANNKAGAMKAFKAAGESCKACHDRYRKADH